MDKPIKDWGTGIPDYTDDDVLDGIELHAFCTNTVAQSMQDDGYTIDGVIVNHTPTQVIANRGGRQYYVIVAGGIYPNEGRISFGMKNKFADFSLNQGVTPMFASVGLMSHDAERAAAGLALKYDGYMIKFTGLEDLSALKTPTPDSKDYRAYCVERIIDAYKTGRFDGIYDLFAENIQYHSQWILNQLVGKKELIAYFDGKGENLRNSSSKVNGSVVVIRRDNKRSGNRVKLSDMFKLSEPEKVCALISQTINGNTNWVFISPKFDQNNKLSDLSLNDPSLFDFVPYYAFE